MITHLVLKIFFRIFCIEHSPWKLYGPLMRLKATTFEVGRHEPKGLQKGKKLLHTHAVCPILSSSYGAFFIFIGIYQSLDSLRIPKSYKVTSRLLSVRLRFKIKNISCSMQEFVLLKEKLLRNVFGNIMQVRIHKI